MCCTGSMSALEVFRHPALLPRLTPASCIASMAAARFPVRASLVQVLQTDLAPLVMEYLDECHGGLLATCSRLRSSAEFAWAAAQEPGFHLFKVDPALRSDTLCRRAVCAHRHRESFRFLWASVPEHLMTLDLMAYACAMCEDEAYSMIPTSMKDDPEFVWAVVHHALEYTDADVSAEVMESIVPAEMLAADRQLALACAKKGIPPCGTDYKLYMQDQEIVEEFLRRHPDWIPAKHFWKVRDAPWYCREWLLKMCRENPRAVVFCFQFESEQMQLEMLAQLPTLELFNALEFAPGDVVGGLWRPAVRRCQRIVCLVGSPHCTVEHSDEALLTQLFHERPDLYRVCREGIRSLRYVASVVFCHDGQQIKDSPFVDDKAMALKAVTQNGLALRWLSPAMQKDRQVLMAAVQQNGLALAWAPGQHSDRLSSLAQTAVRQNPAAAAFMT